MTKHSNPPPLRAFSVEFETYPMARLSFTANIEGASILAEDGSVLTGQLIVGYGTVAGVMERQTRDQIGPYRGVVVQRDGHLEMEAIWDGDRLIDADGADVAESSDSDEDDVT